ncbi:MAG: TIGR03016 family PEP-CTERM system-associated outer membrane protein [Pseudomonadota bacterium]|nr:TIGR03016 family PEP-CTERM system-associated outer membrane protein [Pseudomonadota bacterium]
MLPKLVGALGLAAFAAHAQEAQSTNSRPGFSLEPSVTLRETLTNNVRMQSANPRSDLITEIAPQIRLSSNSGRLKGSFDYTLRGLVYARESSSDEVQQALRAQGTFEAVDNWAYVEANASVSQQSTSAFGTRSSDTALIDSNRSEVFTYQIAPYVRGRLGGFANYEARWSLSSTSSQHSSADSTSQTTSLRVSSDAATFAHFGWSADYSHQTSEFGNRGSRKNDSLNGTLLYTVTHEIQLSARAGRESNDLASVGSQQYNTWGWGGSWAPSERTRLDATRDHRFFGNAYNIRFEHRSQRSVWTFANGQDVNTSPLTAGSANQRTVFDLLFAQFASIAPDPVQRAALVDAFLQNNGLTRTTLANGGLLTSTASVQRHMNVSVALLGLRSTLLFSAFRGQSRAVDPTASGAGDLSNGNTVYQRGFSINASHRLTPQQALSADFSLTNSRGSVGNRNTDLRSLTTTWTNRLSPSVDLSLSARRSLFGSSTNPYNESALVANLRVKF